MLRAYVVDDEPLAIDRLTRLLISTGRVELAGSTTDPRAALGFLAEHAVDVLFLDIQMPWMTGFEMLAKLANPPAVIVTTAYDQYALQAFEVDSVDYLLKPVDPRQLERAIGKAERMRSSPDDLRRLLEKLASSVGKETGDYPERIASRIGERVTFISLARVTHFYAADKLTYAVVDGKAYTVDHTITALEQRLDPKRFVRIHRAILINADFVKEISPMFAGGLMVRLRDAAQTQLAVSRNRAREVRQRLGF